MIIIKMKLLIINFLIKKKIKALKMVKKWILKKIKENLPNKNNNKKIILFNKENKFLINIYNKNIQMIIRNLLYIKIMKMVQYQKILK